MKKSFEKKSFIGKYLHFKSCSSTQDVIRDIDAEWALIRADRQSAGRGRSDGRWLSQPGGLYYSLKLPQDQLPKSSAVLLLAVASLWIDELERSFPSLEGDFSIKWPNDLLLSGKKLAGIIGEKREGSVFLGVGLNVNNDLPDGDYKLPPISLRESLEVFTDVNSLLMSWYRSFVSTLSGKELSSHFHLSELEHRVSTLGETVNVDGCRGRAIGLGTNGELEVELDDETRMVHRSDDVEVQPS